MQLSKNFWLREFCRSETAARMGRAIVPTPDVIEALQWHCQNIMQPIRDDLCTHYGRDVVITISSGYRPLWLNTIIGGASHSDHMWGGASDSEVVGLSVYELVKFIEGRIDRYPIEKLIYEFGDWVHISSPPIHDRASPARKIMTAVKVAGKTIYKNGIIKET